MNSQQLPSHQSDILTSMDEPIRVQTILDESSFDLLQEQAEQELGPKESFVAPAKSSQQIDKQAPKKSDNFFQSNLGRVNLQHEMKPVAIQRHNPFKPTYGNVHENMFAFMLTELDNDVDTLLERLEEINTNLDVEIDAVNQQIGDSGPRQSTKYAEIAYKLKSNLRARVSETMTGRASQDISDSISSTGTDLADISSMGASNAYNNRQSNRQSNRSSRIPPELVSVRSGPALGSVPGISLVDHYMEEMRSADADDSVANAGNEEELLSSCDLFRQIKIENIKQGQQNISEIQLKEKQLRSHAKLEELKIKLLKLITDVKNTVTYNPFQGQHQTLARDSDGIPFYSSFVDGETDDSTQLTQDQERARNQRNKETEKQRLAELLQQIVYQLEKLRFIAKKCIFPRDMTLKMFDPLGQEEEQLGNSRKLGLQQLHNDRYLLLAFKVLQQLNEKITRKMKTNRNARLILQLQSKVQVQNRIYQSFNGFLAEHNLIENESTKSLKIAILKARFELIKNIEQKTFDQIDLTKEMNQHLLRLVMSKHDSKKQDNVELLLKEDIFLTFKIPMMNWGSLFVNQDVDMYYEVSMQIFIGDDRPLSNKSMLPLIRDRDSPVPEGGLSWVFMQIPMQALLTRDLALVIEVHRVTNKYGDVEPMRCFDFTKSSSPIKTLEGWSVINLSASYLLSNLMGGQPYSFEKLRMFDMSKVDKKARLIDKYQSIVPDQVKSSASSAILSQILSINGNFSFESDYKKVKHALKNRKKITVDLYRVFERGIYTQNDEIQQRFISKLRKNFNTIQVTIDSIKIQNPPPNSLIKFEVCLVDKYCNLQQDSWTQTRSCSNENALSIFESETLELTSSTQFRDTMYLRLPTLKSVSEFQNYYLVVIVKIGTSVESNSNNLFRSSVNVLDQFQNDPSLFTFNPTLLAVQSLYSETETMVLPDGKHTPRVLQFENHQLMQMVQRARTYGDNSKIQTWMFSVSPSEVITIKTHLFSNQFSTIPVVNYMFSIKKPNKLSLQNADRILSKMRILAADNPVELLIHHRQLLDKIFLILSMEYEHYDQGAMQLPDPNLIMQDEDRQDVAFETLLLMIDLFYAIFPQYKCLFERYLEVHFNHPKAFVALTAQLRLIGSVFNQDISNANRFWLTQTLSYLPVIVKILRKSFIQHHKLIEKKQNPLIKTDIIGVNAANGMNPNLLMDTVINEEDAENDDASIVDENHLSACFGDQTKETVEGSPQFGSIPKESGQLVKGNNSYEPNMIDEFLSASKRVKMPLDKSYHQTERLKVSTNKTSLVESDLANDLVEDNILMNSHNSNAASNYMNQSMKSEKEKQEIFQTNQQRQMNQARRQVQIISGRLDKDSFAQKKLVRSTWREIDAVNRKSSHFSNFLNNLPDNGKVEEEDIQQNVSESVIDIFKGCHQDGLKITMFLRGILLKNFMDILKEVSLVCGAITASKLVSYLYCPNSLRQQYKQTGQLDSGISGIFQEEEEKCRAELSRNTILSSSFVNELKDDGANQTITTNQSGESLDKGQQKITLMNDFIGSGHFPFGADIDSSTTELSLNQLRVIAMGQILYERILEKIPGNSNQSIEETMIKFAHYINFFGNVSCHQHVSENLLLLRIHVFYFLHQLIFFIVKAECVNGQNDISRIRKESQDEADSLGAKPNQRIKTRHSLLQNPNNYLHKLVDIFMKGLHQLSQDVLMFQNYDKRVQRIIEDHCPYIKEKMSPFVPQCSLVLLTLISHASKHYLLNNVFNRPSILAKILDNFNELDETMRFEAPYNTYVEKQKLDIMAQFNQSVSELIMEQFDRGLPELYIPVVNKLFFRYYYLWLYASHTEFNESRDRQKIETLRTGSNEMVFNKLRLLQNGMKLILKFKRKCLPDIIVFKTKVEDFQPGMGPGTTAKQQAQASQVCMRRDQQQRDLTRIFARMHQFYEKSHDITGLEEVIWLLLEAARLEFELTNQVQASSSVLFQMFTTIKYMQMSQKDLQLQVDHISDLLERMSKTQTSFKVNGELFQKEFARHIALLKKTHKAMADFKKNKTNSNLFLRVLYGSKVIELLGKAQLYYELEKFSKNEYAPILERDFSWNTESAFLHIFRYSILERLVVQERSIYLGEEHIKVSILCNEINQIVEQLMQTRCYALALEKNEQVKNFYQKNYDLEKIQMPLQKETFIYQRMHKDQKKNYASYFKVEFLGAGHLREFRDKKFIMRTPYQTKLDTEEELQERFDEDLIFIEDQWPTEEEKNQSHRKYCHLVKVMPLTLKEIDEFDMHDMVEKGDILTDEDDNQLLEKIQAMPTKLQNFYIQNFKNKFYYQESVRIQGVDGVAFDQKIQIFTVKKKFPYIVGLQNVLTHQEKRVSSVRHAIKSIKDQDNELTIIKKAVREQAIDPNNVDELNTQLRKLLVADINGGFQRYLVNFFSEKSLAIPDRQDLLLTLYTAIEDHFANVRESIELFSQHSTDNSAFQMYYSKLSALERMLQQVQQKTNAHLKLEQNIITQEVNQVTDAMRYSTNVHIDARNSRKQDDIRGQNRSYLFMSQDISRIEMMDRSVSTRYDESYMINASKNNQYKAEAINEEEQIYLDTSQDSLNHLIVRTENKNQHKSSLP